MLNGILYLSAIPGPLIVSYILHISPEYKRVLLGFCIVASLMITGIWGVHSIYVSALLIFIYGIAMSAYSVILESSMVIFAINPNKDYGFYRSMATLGFVGVGLFLGIFPIININSIDQILLFGYTSYLVVFFASIFFIPNNKIPDDKQIGVDRSRTFIRSILAIKRMYFLILILVFFNFTGISVIETFIGLLAKEEYGMKSITSLFVISAGFEIITLYYGLAIVNKLGYANSWFLILGGTTLRLIFLGIHNIYILYFSQTIQIFSFGLLLSTVIHFINHTILPKNKNLALALFQMTKSLATILAVTLGGAILEYTNYYTMYLILSSLPICGLFFLCFNYKKFRNVSTLEYSA